MSAETAILADLVRQQTAAIERQTQLLLRVADCVDSILKAIATVADKDNAADAPFVTITTIGGEQLRLPRD